MTSSFNLLILEIHGENRMSDNIIALVIPVIMIAIIFAWVPLLNLICPTCPGVSGWQHLREVTPSTTPPRSSNRASTQPISFGNLKQQIASF
jgi:hypothetical protein